MVSVSPKSKGGPKDGRLYVKQEIRMDRQMKIFPVYSLYTI